ncbi:MAG: prefoldin subunit alpha [archaeon]
MPKNEKKEASWENTVRPETAKKPSQIRLSGNQLVQLYEGERQKLEALERRLELVQRAMVEVTGTIETISALTKSGQTDSVLLPIGAGIYIEASVENKKNVKASIPGGIVLELTSEDAKEELGKRREELAKDERVLGEELQKSATALNQLGNLLQAGQQKVQEAQKQRTGVA